jgi:hypothetical protein
LFRIPSCTADNVASVRFSLVEIKRPLSSQAESVIAWLKKESALRYVNPFAIALIYVGLGQNDEGFAWLDTAFRERSDMLVYLRVDPRLDSIRPDPRFALLAGWVGVPHVSMERE